MLIDKQLLFTTLKCTQQQLDKKQLLTVLPAAKHVQPIINRPTAITVSIYTDAIVRLLEIKYIHRCNCWRLKLGGFKGYMTFRRDHFGSDSFGANILSF